MSGEFFYASAWLSKEHDIEKVVSKLFQTNFLNYSMLTHIIALVISVLNERMTSCL